MGAVIHHPPTHTLNRVTQLVNIMNVFNKLLEFHTGQHSNIFYRNFAGIVHVHVHSVKVRILRSHAAFDYFIVTVDTALKVLHCRTLLGSSFCNADHSNQPPSDCR